jgi:hypothetical protein
MLTAAVVAVLVGGNSPMFAQSPNPMVGSWTFNAAASKSANPLPKKRELVITQKGASIHVDVNELTATGEALRWSFTTKGDGVAVPVTGWSAVDTATNTLSGRTGKTVYTKDGKTVMESNTEVSVDGQTLVITGTRMGADGKPVAYSSHYDRK